MHRHYPRWVACGYLKSHSFISGPCLQGYSLSKIKARGTTTVSLTRCGSASWIFSYNPAGKSKGCSVLHRREESQRKEKLLTENYVRNLLGNPYVASTFLWPFTHPRLSDISLEVITGSKMWPTSFMDCVQSVPCCPALLLMQSFFFLFGFWSFTFK